MSSSSRPNAQPPLSSGALRRDTTLNSLSHLQTQRNTSSAILSQELGSEDSDNETALDSQSSLHAYRESFRNDFQKQYPAEVNSALPNDTNPDSQHDNDRPSQHAPHSHFPFADSTAAPTTKLHDLMASYALNGAFSIDGACSQSKVGSSAFVGFYDNKCEIQSFRISGKTTNNFAELKALLSALRLAVAKRLKRVLIITDSTLVSKFLRGLLNIIQKQLVAITKEISDLFVEFDAIFVSHIFSHKNISIENDVADALCSWNLEHAAPLSHLSHLHLFEGDIALPSLRNARLAVQHGCSTMPSLISKLTDLMAPLQKAHDTLKAQDSRPAGCETCSLAHTSTSCILAKFALSNFSARQPCTACLSPLHSSEACPLMAETRRRPVLSKFTPKLASPLEEERRERADLLFAQDFSSLTFPNNCSRKQFIDYFLTIFTAQDAAIDDEQAMATVKALQAFRDNFYFQGHCIRRIKPKSADRRDAGNNLNPSPVDDEIIRARRALRAARMMPRARISDVSKALRTSERTPLSLDVIEKLKECYPVAAEDEKTFFEPKPIAFSADRDAVARAIMSRSPASHPGYAGLSFDILQHYCKWTYQAEDPDQPDPRWDVLVRLISKIMSGNATALSTFLLDVVGAWFDKNAEKAGAPFALRNLGIEESLMRISAALVFEIVLPQALQQRFLTEFDFGAGRKSGAEIFGRLASLFSQSGAPVAVFDIIKAFNNLRRRDILNAVAAFNHPLLTAFVHFMFSRDSKVTFTCPITGTTFHTWLTKGIHQGNPLSVFIFCLTIAFILKPFREKYPQALIPTFVDDLLFAMPMSSTELYPAALGKFISLFQAHGLRFDLSDTAKSSIFTIAPLPLALQEQLRPLNIRCQNDGITPCKIPCGSSAFVAAFASKALAKLRSRYKAFDDLLPALLAFDRSKKHPSLQNFEHFLNLVRLSFLSMPMYVLRTLTPSLCVAYRHEATEMALALIYKTLPRPSELPLPPPAKQLPYPDFRQLSQRIMQLPLTLGGLSLRLPDSIGDIAYAAS
jgi:ribonuclease HI